MIRKSAILLIALAVVVSAGWVYRAPLLKWFNLGSKTGGATAKQASPTGVPAAEPEALLTGRVLDDSVERHVLADDDLSHAGFSSSLAVVSYR